MVIDGILYPVDTLKTRTIQGMPPLQLRNFPSLWNGIEAALLPAVPAAASFFVTYEGMRVACDTHLPPSLSSTSTFLAAGVAEAVSCVVRVPAELVKMRMQVNRDSSIAAAMTSTWEQGGLRALYKGLGATLLLDLPFAVVQFPLFEALKTEIRGWRRSHGDADPSTSASDGAFAGGVAGGIAALITTPMDVIRTRHVLRQQPAGTVSFVDTAALIYQSGGLAQFWVGVVPRVGYMFLGGVVYLGTYNYCCITLTRLLG